MSAGDDYDTELLDVLGRLVELELEIEDRNLSPLTNRSQFPVADALPPGATDELTAILARLASEFGLSDALDIITRHHSRVAETRAWGDEPPRPEVFVILSLGRDESDFSYYPELFVIAALIDCLQQAHAGETPTAQQVDELIAGLMASAPLFDRSATDAEKEWLGTSELTAAFYDVLQRLPKPAVAKGATRSAKDLVRIGRLTRKHDLFGGEKGRAAARAGKLDVRVGKRLRNYGLRLNPGKGKSSFLSILYGTAKPGKKVPRG